MTADGLPGSCQSSSTCKETQDQHSEETTDSSPSLMDQNCGFTADSPKVSPSDRFNYRQLQPCRHAWPRFPIERHPADLLLKFRLKRNQPSLQVCCPDRNSTSRISGAQQPTGDRPDEGDDQENEINTRQGSFRFSLPRNCGMPRDIQRMNRIAGGVQAPKGCFLFFKILLHLFASFTFFT